MTDLFRGYDLTTVADKVAEAQWAKRRDEALSRGFEVQDLPEWADVPPVGKHNFKSNLLPIITDVLEALESDQVKPTEGKEMVEYDYGNSKLAGRDDPRWYENQHPDQHDVSKATVWVMHMPLAEEGLPAALERMSVMPETTGEYTFGDSWIEWGEPATEDSGKRLGIYFHATPAQAYGIGYHLANHVTIAVLRSSPEREVDVPPYAVSTSGDFAEQLDVRP